jgi:hypothetical protein
MSLSAASLPVFRHMLKNLAHILDKGAAHAAAKKWDEANLLNFRLYPDMLPFTKQIQIACDAAKLGAARAAGMEWPKYEDNETSFAQLKERVQKTIDFIGTIRPEQVDGNEDKELQIPVGGGNSRTMRTEDYLKLWALPNMFFHITTAYAILRHNGVELGKSDYLAGSRA